MAAAEVAAEVAVVRTETIMALAARGVQVQAGVYRALPDNLEPYRMVSLGVRVVTVAVLLTAQAQLRLQIQATVIIQALLLTQDWLGAPVGTSWQALMPTATPTARRLYSEVPAAVAVPAQRVVPVTTRQVTQAVAVAVAAREGLEAAQSGYSLTSLSLETRGAY